LAKALNDLDVGVVLSGNIINNLRFADDIAAAEITEYYLTLDVNGIVRESSRTGIKINVDKTEIQSISKRKNDTKIFIQGNQFK